MHRRLILEERHRHGKRRDHKARGRAGGERAARKFDAINRERQQQQRHERHEMPRAVRVAPFGQKERSVEHECRGRTRTRGRPRARADAASTRGSASIDSSVAGAQTKSDFPGVSSCTKRPSGTCSGMNGRGGGYGIMRREVVAEVEHVAEAPDRFHATCTSPAATMAAPSTLIVSQRARTPTPRSKSTATTNAGAMTIAVGLVRMATAISSAAPSMARREPAPPTRRGSAPRAAAPRPRRTPPRATPPSRASSRTATGSCAAEDERQVERARRRRTQRETRAIEARDGERGGERHGERRDAADEDFPCDPVGKRQRAGRRRRRDRTAGQMKREQSESHAGTVRRVGLAVAAELAEEDRPVGARGWRASAGRRCRRHRPDVRPGNRPRIRPGTRNGLPDEVRA